MANPDINWLASFITEDPETFQEGPERSPEDQKFIDDTNAYYEENPDEHGYGDRKAAEAAEAAEEPRQAGDVKRASEKMEKASGLKAVLGKINTRQELEQFLMSILKSVNVRSGDMYSAMVKAAKKAKEM